MRTDAGTNAGNPKSAEFPLPVLPAGVGIGLALVHRFRGSAEQSAFPSILSLRQLQSFLASLPSFGTTCDPRHDSFLLFQSCNLHLAQPGNNRLSASVLVASTSTAPLSRRLRFRLLLVRMCRFPACRRTIFPLPVFANRLAAPLWVFTFITPESFG